MKVSTLKKKVSRIWVEVPAEEEGEPAEKVWIDYKPGELTLAVGDKIKEAVVSGFEQDVAFEVLNPLLVAWDLEDEDGNPLPVSEEAIKTLPLEFLGLILQSMEDDARPNASRDATSQDGSSQKASQETSPTGISSSEQPTALVAVPGNSSTDQ